MATCNKGILGPVKGTVGTVTGAVIRGQATIRSRRRKRNKEQESSKGQNAAIGLMSAFLATLHKAVDIGFAAKKMKMTPVNRAVQYNLPIALKGEVPNFEIDYSEVILSIGKGETAWAGELAIQPGLKAIVTWEIPETAKLRVIGKDIAYLVVYDTTFKKMIPQPNPPLRANLSGSLTVYDTMKGHEIHVWIFFISPDGKTVSNSDYVGSGTVI
jgi:hypothetical protein